MRKSKTPSLQGLSALSANTDAARARVHSFRYAVLVRELQLKPPGIDHDAQKVIDPLDDGAALLYVESENEIIASLRLRHTAASQLPQKLEDRYQLGRFVGFGKGALATTGGITIARKEPAIAARVIFNLSLTLCERLADNTTRLGKADPSEGQEPSAPAVAAAAS